jgi:hypothetical protein
LTGIFPSNLEGPIPEVTEDKILHAVKVVAENSENVTEFKDIASMLGIFEEKNGES